MKYIVIERICLCDLINSVNALRQDGWVCIGGIACGDGKFYQAMTFSK